MAKKKKKKKKVNVLSHIAVFLLILVGFVLGMIILSIGFFMYFNAPLNAEDRIVTLSESDGIKLADNGGYYVEVRRGESSQSVGLRLERAALISSRYFWNVLCRIRNEHIKTGTYLIEMPLSQLAIHSILISGKQILYKVTIPEGVTLKKSAAILEEAGICSAEDFFYAAHDPEIIKRYGIPNASMEGYLFPDTYLFPAEYPASRTVTAMADNFFKKLEQIDSSIFNISPDELNKKVILASIIEREYRAADEAPLMAGVFQNRLNINMALQSCATVEYIITEIQGKPHPSVIYNADLEIRDPYNTYIRPGLPPGPISAPGALALRSAFFPQKTEYLYFRLVDIASGRHYFSRTYDEHIRAGSLIPKGRS